MSTPKRSRPRAARGQPSPFQRADGRWVATLDLGRRTDGRRWRLPVYGRSAEEVRARIPGARARALSGVRPAVDPGVTVGVYARFWIDEIEPTWEASGRRTGIKHSTWRGYEKHVRLSIAHTDLGQTRVDRLTPRMVRTWRDWLQSPERGLGPRSAAYALKTLQLLLDHAREESELIVTNPARDVAAPPQRTDYEARIFTLAEARRFLEIIGGHQDEALYLVSVFAGPRQGESLALRDGDYDPDTGVIRFMHTLDWIGGAASIEEAKTSTSRRSVRLPVYVVEALARHRSAVDSQRARPEWIEYGLLFPGRKGQPLRGSTVYRRFQRLLAANCLPPLRWHDLRHSSASILLALGVPMQVVQRILGHSSLEMISKRYGHLVPELAASELAKVEHALLEFERAEPLSVSR